MGYTAMLWVAGVLVVLVLAALVSGRGRTANGQIPGDPGKPPIRTEPSADAPTPDAATGISPKTAEAARKHTPPA